MKVFVTGCAAHLADSLLPQLCAHPDIQRVRGIDLLPCRYQHQKLEAARLDMLSPHLPTMLKGCDALVHMAFIVHPGRMKKSAVDEINLGASQYVFDCAKAAGIKRVLHISSAAVYGNGENLDERAPLKPIPGFAYAQQKMQLELWLSQHHPTVLRLRPHIILGPNAQASLKRRLRHPVYVRLPDPQPLLQCVHEDDVSRAIVLGLFEETSGALNLATEDSFNLRDVIRVHHPMSIGVALPTARAALTLAWRITGRGERPVWLEGVKRSLTLNCDLANGAINWRPQFSAHETINLSF